MPSGNWNVPFNIVLAGDSLALLSDDAVYDGFSRWLRDYYDERAGVYNVGIEKTSSQAYLDFIRTSAFDTVMPNHVDLAVVLLGTEDCADENKSVTTPQVYADNLRAIVEKLRAYTPNVAIAPPPPMKSALPGHSDPQLIEQYAEQAKVVADQTGSFWADIRGVIKENEKILRDDCVAFNPLGNYRYFDALQKIIDPTFNPQGWYVHSKQWKYCNDGKEYTADKQCSCPIYSRYKEADDSCQECPLGSFYDATKKLCECSTVNVDYIYDSSENECVCAPEKLQAHEECLACPANSYLSPDQSACVCSAANTVFNEYLFACECDSKSYLKTDACVLCPDGQKSTADKLSCECKYAEQLFVKNLDRCECPENQQLYDGQCVACGKDEYRLISMSVCVAKPKGYSTATFGWSMAAVIVGGLAIGGVAGWYMARRQAKKAETSRNE